MCKILNVPLINMVCRLHNKFYCAIRKSEYVVESVNNPSSKRQSCSKLQIWWERQDSTAQYTSIWIFNRNDDGNLHPAEHTECSSRIGFFDPNPLWTWPLGRGLCSLETLQACGCHSPERRYHAFWHTRQFWGVPRNECHGIIEAFIVMDASHVLSRLSKKAASWQNRNSYCLCKDCNMKISLSWLYMTWYHPAVLVCMHMAL